MGALRVLPNAGALRVLPHGTLEDEYSRGHVPVRHVHGARVLGADLRRPIRRPLARTPSRRAGRGLFHGPWLPSAGHRPAPSHVRRDGSDHSGQRTFQAQHLSDGRRALPGGRSAPR